jgi:hypothetical protein
MKNGFCRSFLPATGIPHSPYILDEICTVFNYAVSIPDVLIWEEYEYSTDRNKDRTWI